MEKIGHIRETKFLAVMSVVFLILQALLGAAAVVFGSSALIMALHFGISLISFASVLLLTLLVFEADSKQKSESFYIGKTMQFHMIGIIIYTYVVVYTGAYVRHTSSSLACLDFPMCSTENGWLPGSFTNGCRWDTELRRFFCSPGSSRQRYMQQDSIKIKNAFIGAG